MPHARLRAVSETEEPSHPGGPIRPLICKSMFLIASPRPPCPYAVVFVTVPSLATVQLHEAAASAGYACKASTMTLTLTLA